MRAYFSEFFSSIQGEGPYLGERHLFIRFCECHRKCIYCDTNINRTKDVLIEREAGSGFFHKIPNPLSIDDVLRLISELDTNRKNARISITGGEPLLQYKFLKEILPKIVESNRSIYLETAGDLPNQLQSIINWIDIVAMDIKLSSVTHDKNKFLEHWNFLNSLKSSNTDYFVKIVVSDETDKDELLEAAEGIKNSSGKNTLVILQPISPTNKVSNIPSFNEVVKWQEALKTVLDNVRIIPQTHKIMEIL